MRFFALFAAAALGLGALGFAGPAAAQQDVLAPARGGQLQCYTPDLARQTCSALASYTLRSDGGYDNQARVLIAQSPAIVVTSTSPVTIRNGAVCGPFTAAHLEAAQFTIDGQPASAEDSATLRGQLAGMPDFLADEICTTYTPTGDGLRATFSVNGQARPNESAQVIWVRADEGYTVAP